MQTQNPFKGPSSYEDGDKFYGRKDEIKDLVGLIRNETLTMLFSRSGTGKSSLLKAGLFPELRNESEFFPIYLHLNEAVVKEAFGNNLCHYIIKKCKDEIENYFKDKKDFEVTIAEDTGHNSLFEFIHFTELKEVDKTSETEYIIKPVLIFDQFEEIFTSPFDKNDLHLFLKEINCLIENELPDYLRGEALTNESSQFTKLKNTLKSKQKNFRLAFAFREEYLPQFESLRKEIPALRFTNSRYRLEPFTIETALDIIVSTAPDISAETALEVAENISTDMEGFEEKRVDPFLLSLICQIIYHDLQEVDDNKTEDSKDKIKGLVENAVETYVQKVYKGINEETRKFIETRLITSEGKKNSVNYNDVQANVSLMTDILRLVDNPESRLLSIGQFLDSRHITILHDRLLPPLIHRKEERRLSDQNMAFMESKEKFDRENKRRQKFFLWIFATAIIALGLILFMANRAKIRTDGLLLLTEISNKKADSLNKIAKRKEEEAKSQVAINKKLNDDATKRSEKAIQDSIRSAIAITKAKSQLLSEKNANTELNATIATLQKSIDSNFVQRDLNQLTLEGQGLKELLFINLFKLKNTHQEVAYLEYLFAVQRALELKTQANSIEANSYDLLGKAKTLWTKHKDNEVVDAIISELLNKNLFYSQLVTLEKVPYVNYKTFLAFSEANTPNKSNFVFNVDKKLYLGTVQSDSLAIGVGISFPAFETNSINRALPADPVEEAGSFSRLDTGSIYTLADTVIMSQPENYLSSLVYYSGQISGVIRGNLFGYSPVTKKYLPRALKLERHDYEVLSPNGRYLVTYSDFDSVHIRDLTKEDQASVTLKIRPYNNIRSVVFSNDSKRLLVLERSNEYIVYNILPGSAGLIEQNIKITNMRTEQIMAVNFAPDGNSVIAATNRSLSLSSLNEKKPDTTFNPNYLIPELLNYYDEIRSISLSPDSGKILLQTPVSLIVLMKKNGTVFTYKDQFEAARVNVTYKVFNTSGYNAVGSFINSNSLVLVSDIGKVYFLKIYPEFTSIGQAFSEIKLPELTPLERLKIDPGNEEVFTEILNSNKNKLLIEAAQTFYHNYLYPKNYVRNVKELEKAKTLCKAFIQNEKRNVTQTDLFSVRSGFILIKQLSGIDTSKSNKEKYYTDLLVLANKYVNAQTPAELSIIYGNLSFYSFFSRNYSKGLNYAEKGLDLDTRPNSYIYTNKVLGLLFNKMFEEAETLYHSYKDSTVSGRTDLFKNSFLQDLTDLENYGIITQKEPVIWEEVKRIREYLLK